MYRNVVIFKFLNFKKINHLFYFYITQFATKKFKISQQCEFFFTKNKGQYLLVQI